jgi:sugar phosphate isomerase/epimerase
MNRLSLAPLTVSDAGPLDLISAAMAGGFDAVDLRVIGPPGVAPVAPVAGDPALVKEIGHRLADTGISVFSATGIFITPDFALAEIEPALAIVAALGGRWCLAAGWDADDGRLAANFALACETAAGFSLGIAFEFMPYSEVPDLDAATRLLEAAAQPNGALVIDALHLARSGGTPEAVAALPRQRIAYCQLCDAPGKQRAELGLRAESLRHRLYPGAGELPLFDLMAALPPDVTIDLETPVAADAHLPVAERGRRAGDAIRHFLAAYRAR